MKEAVHVGSIVFGPKVQAAIPHGFNLSEAEREATRKADQERIDKIESERSVTESMREASEREAAWNRLCPPIYRDTDIDRLPRPAEAIRVTAWEYNPKGMILHGPTRAGKSRAAWLLMRRLYDEGKTITAFDGIGWFFAVGSAFRDMEKAEGWLDGLTRCDVLFLDDIFRGRVTDAQDLALWGALERRTANRKPVIITTNATSGTLETKTGEQLAPIISRLREFCDDVAFA